MADAHIVGCNWLQLPQGNWQPRDISTTGSYLVALISCLICYCILWLHVFGRLMGYNFRPSYLISGLFGIWFSSIEIIYCYTSSQLAFYSYFVVLSVSISFTASCPQQWIYWAVVRIRIWWILTIRIFRIYPCSLLCKLSDQMKVGYGSGLFWEGVRVR